jgi:hypothetical protein
LAPIVHRQLVVALATEVLGAEDALQCATGTEMADAGVSGSVAPGDAASALGSSSAMILRLLRSYLPGSLDSVPPPINWRQVENEAKSMSSQVATTERLLHEALASVHHNILHPVWVSLRKEAKIQFVLQWLPPCLLIFLCFASVASILGQRRCHCIAGGGCPSMGSYRCCRGGPLLALIKHQFHVPTCRVNV